MNRWPARELMRQRMFCQQWWMQLFSYLCGHGFILCCCCYLNIICNYIVFINLKIFNPSFRKVSVIYIFLNNFYYYYCPYWYCWYYYYRYFDVSHYQPNNPSAPNNAPGFHCFFYVSNYEAYSNFFSVVTLLNYYFLKCAALVLWGTRAQAILPALASF